MISEVSFYRRVRKRNNRSQNLQRNCGFWRMTSHIYAMKIVGFFLVFKIVICCLMEIFHKYVCLSGLNLSFTLLVERFWQIRVENVFCDDIRRNNNKKMATCWGALNVIIKAEKFGHVCTTTANENLVLVASWP